MMILHGLWIVEEEFMLEGRFFLWGERLRPDIQHDPVHRIGIHPYTLSPEELSKHLEIPGAPYRYTLVLPSTELLPIHSSLTDTAPLDKAILKEWDTPGLVIKDEDMLNFLTLLDEDTMKRKGIFLGEDLIFWSKTARFGIDLTCKQRFLPWLRYINEEKLACYWHPVFINEEEKGVFSNLKDSMPDSARCYISHDNPPLPQTIIQHFLTFLVNHIIDTNVGYDLKKFFTDDKYSGLPGRIFEAARKDILIEQFNEWSSPIKIKPQEKGFRMCFRLEAPSNNLSSWHLRFLLQSFQDQSLLINLKDIWNDKKKELSIVLPNDFHHQLFTDLGVAQRLFPQIEKALKVSKPHSLEISIHEAYSFLQQSSILLMECGFGVFVPSFWDSTFRKGRQPGVTMRVSPITSAGLSQSQLINFDWQIAIGNSTISKEEFEQLVKLKIPLVNVRGQWVELQPEQAGHILDNLKEKEELSLSELIKLSMGGDELGLPVTEIKAKGWIKELLEGLKGKIAFEELPQPDTFRGTLRQYQVRGFSWMAYMNRFGLGICLADDMGLGKTIQFIALLLYQKQQKLKGPSLLVCPTSVVGNWQRELARFAPHLKVLIHHGLYRHRGNEFKKKVTKADIVITSYSLLHRDKESLKDINFRYIVLDEAQNIKNPYTKQAQAARSINGNFRIALTGTPIENRLSELWSIMDFLNPGYLKGLNEFKQKFAIPIERYSDKNRSEVLKSMIGPFILRRLKTDSEIISDLPSKVEVKTYCPLTKEQATLYQATVDNMMKGIESSEGIKRKGAVLSLLMRLKQICNHPASFLSDNSQLHRRSGKLERLKEMLEEVLEEGDSALIFTQFAQMGKLIKPYLEQTFLHDVLFLYGELSREKREAMIARFQNNEGPALFILSLKAGGFGLNLTKANHVFHFDRWWNPAVENQATDRCFRIGQKKNVMVHKFICQGTMEEKIDEMLEKKRELVEMIIGSGEGWITEFSTEKLRQLFSLEKQAVTDMEE